MNKFFKVIVLLAAFAGFASCVDPVVTPTGDERTIIYSVGDREEHRIVKSDTELDALLDDLCLYALQGDQVAFYSIGNHSTSATKEATSISTTDRNELKRWMKAMEKAGKTVNVTYDEHTGTWNGMAYASMPVSHDGNGCYTGVLTCVEMPIDDYAISTAMVPALRVNEDTLLVLMKYGYTLLCGNNFDEGDTTTLCGTIETHQLPDNTEYLALNLTSVSESVIAGSWLITSMTGAIDSTQNNGDIFEFNDDGTAQCTHDNQTTSGTWSIGDNGSLCCELLPSGGCWNINWISPLTLIISQINNNSYSIIVFEKNIETK